MAWAVDGVLQRPAGLAEVQSFAAGMSGGDGGVQTSVDLVRNGETAISWDEGILHDAIRGMIAGNLTQGKITLC